MSFSKGRSAVRAATILGALICFYSGVLFADPITYQVNVDTSSISGISGAIEFQFGGFGAQDAIATISGFSPSGSLGSIDFTSPTGVSGSLPGVLSLDNVPAGSGSDYLQGFTYSTSISFLLSFSGDALSNPNNGSFGSSFAFTMFDGGVPSNALLSDPAGPLFTVDVNPDGSTSPSNNSIRGAATIDAVPEPSAFWLFMAAGAGLLVLNRKAFGNSAS